MCAAGAGKTPGKFTSAELPTPSHNQHPGECCCGRPGPRNTQIQIQEMVSFVDCDSCSECVTGGENYNRRRMNGESPPTETLTPAQRPQTARQRKQKLMFKFSDSGFEEDLGSSPISSPVRIDVQDVEVHLSSWYLQYGDIGYKIQVEKEAQYHPCKSLARQPQVGNNRLCTMLSEWTTEWKPKLNCVAFWLFCSLCTSLLFKLYTNWKTSASKMFICTFLTLSYTLMIYGRVIISE